MGYALYFKQLRHFNFPENLGYSSLIIFTAFSIPQGEVCNEFGIDSWRVLTKGADN